MSHDNVWEWLLEQCVLVAAGKPTTNWLTWRCRAACSRTVLLRPEMLDHRWLTVWTAESVNGSIQQSGVLVDQTRRQHGPTNTWSRVDYVELYQTQVIKVRQIRGTETNTGDFGAEIHKFFCRFWTVEKQVKQTKTVADYRMENRLCHTDHVCTEFLKYTKLKT